MNRRTPLNRQGFSLIELMVVITIIGVLGTIVTVNVIDYLNEADVTTTKAQTGELVKVLNKYYMDNGRKFPKNLKSLEEKSKKTGEPYMKTLPSDAWGADFLYKRLKNGRDFELTSYGADGRDGGQGFDTDIKASKTGIEQEKK